MLKVVVIGSGNVAQHLITVFEQSGNVELVQAYARHPEHIAHLLPASKITGDAEHLAEADVYIIAVTDDAIADVSAQLPFEGRLVLHTSGSVAMEQLSANHRRGVFYPLQTFSKNKAVDFKQVPLCIEAENEADLQLLEQLASTISDNVYHISSGQRQALHVAAVFVSNFTNHMYTLGSDICRENNISFDILKPLIQETAAKVMELEPAQAQTGPAVRHDEATIQRHLDFLEDENQKAIYKLLTDSIQQTNVQKL
jgi:predicted short-subunit dehydrogenase-like oxidoreductase (DUF2520 family)